MLTLDRTPLMKLSFLSKIRLVCFFDSIKSSYMDFPSIDHNRCLETAVRVVGPKKSGRVVGANLLHVLRVHGLRYVSQVFDPIVKPVTVEVVDNLVGPAPIDVKPNKAMRFVDAAVDGNMYSSRRGVEGACNFSSPFCIPRLADAGFAELVEGAGPPHKRASFGVVIEKFSNALRSKIGLSHAVVPFPNNGLVRARIALVALCGLVYFSVPMLDSGGTVDLDNGDTSGGLHAAETGGILGAGRAAAILNAPVQPHERP